jgi:hypothetical protein
MRSSPRGTWKPAAESLGRAALALARVASLVALLVLAGGGRAFAAPEAHFLRIDPRAANTDGSPVLTTVLELVQNKRMSDLTGKCATLTGDRNIDCVSSALEQPGALYSSFEFPEKNAFFTITVDGTDMPARFDSKARWTELAGQPGVGTAFLILVDAASSMGPSLDDAKGVATAFVNTMSPNDIADVMFFNDKGVVGDSHWVAAKQAALATINSVTRTFPSQGRTRPLGMIIKQAATDGFNELGNAGQGVNVPLHQALVLLSNGSAGADTSTNLATASVVNDYLTKGRFPEGNDVRPKMPVPVISIWFPNKLIEEFQADARQFMEGLSNPTIGGFFSIIRDRSAEHATNIVNAVRTRFGKMHVVKWRVACVAPTISQSFKLVFTNTTPVMAGDSWPNVPIGIDPTTWPLDIDVAATQAAAKKNPVYPGGSVQIFGNFCWGGNAQRAEIYMVPKNQTAPGSLQGGSVDDAKKAQTTLIQAGMRGKATSAGDTVVEFDLPSSDKFLAGSGAQMSARMVLYDNQAHRTSAVTADKILTLRAQQAPYPLLLIGGITFGGVVIILLLVAVFRGGGGRKRGSGAMAPPRPIVAGGAPPGYAPIVAPPPGPDMYGGGGMMGGPMGGMGPPLGGATRATLSGPGGIFTVLPGMEMRAGRDGGACQILLTEPRVSGTHATVKFEGGQLLVRDENSNNGCFVNGQRLPGNVWTPVPPGSALRFGPVEFSVRLE